MTQTGPCRKLDTTRQSHQSLGNSWTFELGQQTRLEEALIRGLGLLGASMASWKYPSAKPLSHRGTPAKELSLAITIL